MSTTRTLELGDGVVLELDSVGEGRLEVAGVKVLVDVECEPGPGGPVYRVGCLGLPDGRGEGYACTEAQAVRNALMALARDFARMRDAHEADRTKLAAFVHGLAPAVTDAATQWEHVHRFQRSPDEDFDEPPTPLCNHGERDLEAAARCIACSGTPTLELDGPWLEDDETRELEHGAVHWFPGEPGILVCGEPAEPPRQSTCIMSEVTCEGCTRWLERGAR